MHPFQEIFLSLISKINFILNAPYAPNLYFYGGILNSIGFSIIGIRVFLHNPKELRNRGFAAFNLAAFCWSIPYIFWAASENQAVAMFWLRILNATAVFTAPAFLFFIVAFLGMYDECKKLVKTMFIILGCFTVPFLFTHLLIADAVRDFHPFYRPVAGPLLLIYLLFWGGTYIYAVYLLFKVYPKQQERPINEWWIFIATLLCVGGGSSNFYMWYFAKVPPFGNIVVVLWALVFMVLITRNRLFGIRAITGEVFSFSVWVFSVINIFLAEGVGEKMKALVIFLIATAFSAFFLKSLSSEMQQKEKYQNVAKQLKDLNEHLEDKVREQTKEIRRAYEVEKKARHDLEELDKAKTDFILTTQHHLRTPLTVVKSALSLLKSKGDHFTTEERDKFIEKADQNTNKLAILINEFLDISQMEVGKSILEKRETFIHPIIEDVLGELLHEIEQKQLQIGSSFTEEARETTLNIDSKKMRDAVLNLIDNAVKYTSKEGSITIQGEIIIHPIERTKMYRLTITDTGIGMTEEEKEKVFTRSFERGMKAKEMNTTGRGIGLILTKQIVEAHGGSIHAQSQGRDMGSVFVVEIPVEGKES